MNPLRLRQADRQTGRRRVLITILGRAFVVEAAACSAAVDAITTRKAAAHRHHRPAEWLIYALRL